MERITFVIISSDSLIYLHIIYHHHHHQLLFILARLVPFPVNPINIDSDLDISFNNLKCKFRVLRLSTKNKKEIVPLFISIPTFSFYFNFPRILCVWTNNVGAKLRSVFHSCFFRIFSVDSKYLIWKLFPFLYLFLNMRAKSLMKFSKFI